METGLGACLFMLFEVLDRRTLQHQSWHLGLIVSPSMTILFLDHSIPQPDGYVRPETPTIDLQTLVELQRERYCVPFRQ